MITVGGGMEGGQQLICCGSCGGAAEAAPLTAACRQRDVDAGYVLPEVDAGYVLPEPAAASREGRGGGGNEGSTAAQRRG